MFSITTSLMHKARLAACVGLTALCVASPTVHAGNDYPSKPVSFVVPFAAGNVVDLMARTFATHISESIGQSVIVENKAGAFASIGANYVARAQPDGYTMLNGTNVTHSINPQIMKSIRYDPVNDFEAVAVFGVNGNVLLVNKDLPVNDFAGFIEYVKANPGKLNHGASIGSSAHLAAELLKREVEGLDYTLIPHNSGTLPALIGGHLDFIFTNVGTAIAQIQAGQVKVLAVTTKERIPQLPDTPTIAESGVPGFEVIGWGGVFMPKGTPPAVIKRMNAEINKAQDNADLRKIMDTSAVILIKTTPEEAAAFVRHEYDRWGEVIRAANIQVD